MTDAPSVPDLSKATPREQQRLADLLSRGGIIDRLRAELVDARGERDAYMASLSYACAERDELVAALQWIGKTAKGIEPRVFDEMMRDLMLIDDRCRAVLAKVNADGNL